MPECKTSQHHYISELADQMLTLSFHNTVFIKLSKCDLRGKKKSLAPLIVWEVGKHIGWWSTGQIYVHDGVPGTEL